MNRASAGSGSEFRAFKRASAGTGTEYGVAEISVKNAQRLEELLEAWQK